MNFTTKEKSSTPPDFSYCITYTLNWLTQGTVCLKVKCHSPWAPCMPFRNGPANKCLVTLSTKLYKLTLFLLT